MLNNKEFILKKTIIALTMGTLMSVASAAVVSFEADRVKDDKTHAEYTAQYLRVNGTVDGLDLGVQARTATFPKGGMMNSIELTGGSKFGPVSAFAGVGFDNGLNGVKPFQYGLVGASTGVKFGVINTYAGVKTRVNWDSVNPKQTVMFAGASMPVMKGLALEAGVSKSLQTIKETSWGLGLSAKF
jgi:hypothetical protein